MSQILVFGDSETYGAWDKKGGWVARLRSFVDERIILSEQKFYCLIYNLGIDGDTTENLLKRFDFETKQRLQEKETIIIFAIGGNDSVFLHSKNSNIVSPIKFKKNIQKLIKLAKNFDSEIIFIGLSHADELKTVPVFWNKEMSYKNEYIRQYDEIIKSVCQENKVDFIEIFEKFKKMDYKKLLEDGVHPNSKGHSLIYETVKDFLIAKKII